MRYKVFKSTYLGNICRDCIKKKTGIKFDWWETEHEPFEKACSKCGIVRSNIVGVKTYSRWKIWFCKVKK